jgi:phosphoglycerate dehydrogenase-like enzyme
MKKLFFACKIEDAEARARIARLGELIEDPAADSPEKLAVAAEGAHGVILPYTSQILLTAETLNHLTTLELVGTTYGGVRQNIDEMAALKRGLLVTHTGPTRIRPMAEYTLALTLSALTQIPNYHHYMKSGDAWPRAKFGRTRILSGRSVGIIGYGLIGKGIADVFRKFTDQIKIFSRHSSSTELAQDGFEKADSLEDLFASTEVIILAGGYNPETHHMIQKRHFEAMADEALFVNIARGKMVDQRAMIEVVRKKNILLALDVFENEPLEEDSELRSNDRCIIVPHRANAPREFEERWKFVADELERYCRGERPQTALTVERARAMSES